MKRAAPFTDDLADYALSEIREDVAACPGPGYLLDPSIYSIDLFRQIRQIHLPDELFESVEGINELHRHVLPETLITVHAVACVITTHVPEMCEPYLRNVRPRGENHEHVDVIIHIAANPFDVDTSLIRITDGTAGDPVPSTLIPPPTGCRHLQDAMYQVVSTYN